MPEETAFEESRFARNYPASSAATFSTPRSPPKICSLFEVNRPDRILLARLVATLGQNIEGVFRLLRERFESNLFQLETLIRHPASSLDLQEQETTCFDLVESPIQFGDILDRGTVDRIDEISGLDIVACRCDADELGGHDYSVRSLRRGGSISDTHCFFNS